MDEQEQQAKDYGLPRKLITISLFGLVGVFVVLTYMSLGSNKADSFAWCLITSAALAISWPLVSKLDNLKIGPTGLELTRKVEEANAKADDASNKAYDALTTITRFVFNSMPQPTFYNLRKISSGNFGPYNLDNGFREQLRNLRDSGYIATNSGYIAQIPSQGQQLSDFVYCTELGQEFILQREAAEKAAIQRKMLSS